METKTFFLPLNQPREVTLDHGEAREKRVGEWMDHVLAGAGSVVAVREGDLFELLRIIRKDRAPDTVVLL